MKFVMLEKIKVLLDEGITEVIQSRYVDNKLVTIFEEEQQPLVTTELKKQRLSDHYLPEKVKGV